MKRWTLFLAIAVSLLMETSAIAIDRFVDASAPPGGSGLSWTSPYNSLSTALSIAGSGDNVFVAEGTYSPGATASSTFTIPAGVKVYGGFQNGEAFGEQNPLLNTSTLDGNDIVRHVLTLNSSPSNVSILSGFTITGGNATSGGPSTDFQGGGVLVVGSDAQITNCVFVANVAAYGGGLADSGSTASSTLISNCAFLQNEAWQNGGGTFIQSRTAVFQNCLFAGNIAFNGGGIYTSKPIHLRNCTVANNVATNTNGGGIYIQFQADMTNCIFWGNVAGGSTNESAQIRRPGSGQAPVFARHTCIQGLSFFSSGTGNIGDNPLFMNVSTNDFRLQSNSPAANAGVDSGVFMDSWDVDYDQDQLEPTPDLDLNCRLAGGPVDMGAYEMPSDCNGDQIPDCYQVAGNDCDGDNIPDDCALDADQCHDIDCDLNGEIDACQLCGVDVIFIIDTSDSNDQSIPDFCQYVVDVVENQVAVVSSLSTVRVFKLGSGTNTANCLNNPTVVDYFGFPGVPLEVPGPSAACGILPPEDMESWGAAVSIASSLYPWRGNVRVVVPFSDEGPCNGSPVDIDDEMTLDAAISLAIKHHINVIPVSILPGSTLAQIVVDIGLVTSGFPGIVVDGSNPQYAEDLEEAGIELAGAIVSLVQNATTCVEVVDCGGCPGDCVSCFGVVNVSDLFHLLAVWNTNDSCAASLAPPNDIVNVSDLFVLLSNWDTECTGQSLPQSIEDCLNQYGADPEQLEKCISLMEE